MAGIRDQYGNWSYLECSDKPAEAPTGPHAQNALRATLPSFVSDRSLMISSLVNISSIFIEPNYAPSVAVFSIGWELGRILHSTIKRFF